MLKKVLLVLFIIAYASACTFSYDAYIQNCQMKEHASDEDTQSILTFNDSSSSEIGCIWGCFLEEMGFVVDGALDGHAFHHFFVEEYEKFFDSVVDFARSVSELNDAIDCCGTLIEQGSRCEGAMNFINCIDERTGIFNLSRFLKAAVDSTGKKPKKITIQVFNTRNDLFGKCKHKPEKLKNAEI